ncbi:MAG: hypothetical protein AAF770_01465 [Bacteroidota bacterium]
MQLKGVEISIEIAPSFEYIFHDARITMGEKELLGVNQLLNHNI